MTHKLDKWDRYKQHGTSSWSVATSTSTSSVDKYDPDQLKEDILRAKQRVTSLFSRPKLIIYLYSLFRSMYAMFSLKNFSLLNATLYILILFAFQHMLHVQSMPGDMCNCAHVRTCVKSAAQVKNRLFQHYCQTCNCMCQLETLLSQQQHY